MKILVTIFLLGLTAASFEAGAAKRPDVRSMTCRDVTALVKEANAIMLTTGRYTYGIFASNPSYCDPEMEHPPYAHVETLDNPSCWIGYECKNSTYARSGGTSIIGTSVGCKEGQRARRKDKFVIHPQELICRGGKWQELEI